MAGCNQYKTQQFIDAIPGSGGIITTIAKRVGCAWHTAQKYIGLYSTVQKAYDDECAAVLDMAESKVIGLMEKSDGPMLRYYLSTKGKGRGYVERVQQEITGKDGGAVILEWPSADKITPASS